jgi:hypothetical protein
MIVTKCSIFKYITQCISFKGNMFLEFYIASIFRFRKINKSRKSLKEIPSSYVSDTKDGSDMFVLNIGLLSKDYIVFKVLTNSVLL